ncbi:MAG: ATP-dependent endonuclease [Flavobacteriales bacterium]|nr:ATP-dependent endonuclease [Flavobacteriales bacterium]|tara:strand:- start:20935 stop:22338 length:1404 start_codon:yes stop_codon:yes gene_type:complete
MNSKKLQEKLRLHFPFDPTSKQSQIITDISDYIATVGSKSIFILKGYAGTGKTTLISTLVKSLPVLGKRSVLIAPTGRAAKVLSKYSGKTASTIHKKIYWIRTSKSGNTFITLKENTHRDTIFLVDEASMIAEKSDKGFGNRSLLDDLIKYVYDGYDCKLILVGDTAQLPPVHLEISPALDEEKIEANYNKQVICKELIQVVRQRKNSVILRNATNIRNRINNADYSYPKLATSSEVIRLNNGEDLQDALEAAYNNEGINSTTVLCRSNKRANLYNQQIRAKIKWQEKEISSGDMLMVVRNNYHWLDDNSKAGFIANGDIVKVLKIRETIERYGFRFAKATIQLIDYNKEQSLDVILLLDTLSSKTPAITYEQYQNLYKEVSLDYKGEKEINKKIKKDPFFNALQIKFAYAITCHKSQGGQWDNVFIDLGYFTEDMLNKSYLRWLYTAITRSTKKLFLINFNEQFFK